MVVQFVCDGVVDALCLVCGERLQGSDPGSCGMRLKPLGTWLSALLFSLGLLESLQHGNGASAICIIELASQIMVGICLRIGLLLLLHVVMCVWVTLC